MSEQSKTILKSYFETDAIPTSDQFANFIDSVINTRDNEITVTSGNIGFGNSNPLTNISVQSKTFQLSGSVSAIVNSNSFTGKNTALRSQLTVGEIIQIGEQTFTVASIASDTTFTTHQNASTSITNARIIKTSDIFSVLDSRGTPIIYITKDGKVGFSKTNPSELVDIAGNLKAESFIGEASGLTSIPAKQLKGIVPQSNLPEMKISSVDGLLTITETYDQPLSGTVSGQESTVILKGTGTKFMSELLAGQKIKIKGDILEVLSISSDTELTLKNKLDDAITEATAFTAGGFLKLVDVNGNTVVSVDGSGNLTANKFSGEASGLTSIPAKQLKGIVPQSNLPEMKISFVDGLLTITETYDQPLSGTVSGQESTAILKGTGTKFMSELLAGQKIKIKGNILEVLSISSDTELTLKNKLDDAITEATAFTAGGFLKLVDVNGNTVVSVDGSGNLTANKFSGEASGLTSIPAKQLKGIVPQSNLPEMKISSVDGLLTITETYDQPLLGTVSGQESTAILKGTGTKFMSELLAGQKIKIKGDILEVLSISSDTELTLKNKLDDAITEATAFTAGGFLKLVDVNGNTVVSVDGSGNLTANKFSGDASGLTNIPADKITGNLNLTGEITATGFTGNGSKLTTLNATQITGLIPKASIPTIDASQITGKFAADQIPMLTPSKVEKYISVIANQTILSNEVELLLSWKTNSVTNLEVEYLYNGAVVKLSSSRGDIALSESNYSIKNLYQNTIFTFTSTDVNGKVIDQYQLYITVISTANQYTKQLRWEGFGIAYVIQQVANRFALSELTTITLKTLGTAIFNAGYLAAAAFRYIPKYYRSQGETWDPTIDGEILNKIYSGGGNTQTKMNALAKKMVTAGEHPEVVIRSVVTTFDLQTSNSINITALGISLKSAGIPAVNAFRYIPSYYRSVNQPWDPEKQGVVLTKVYTN